MSKFDDFWNDIAPTQKGDETPPGANNTNADIETALAKANNEIENLKKMISELKPKEETTNKETEVKEKEEENNENE